MKIRLLSSKCSFKEGKHKRNDRRQTEESFDGASSISSETSQTQDMINYMYITSGRFVDALPNGSESVFCGNDIVTETRPTFMFTTGNVTGTQNMIELTVPYQRSSLKQNNSFSGGKGHHSMSFLPQKSVSFDQTVSFVTVPRLSDICSQYPRFVFYNKDDFAIMADLAQRDAEKIKQMNESNPSTEKMPISDNVICDLGIEHRTCTAKERFDREVKARAAILAVLREQKRHSHRYCSGGCISAEIEKAVAKASMNATKEAVIRARERALQLEDQCSSPYNSI